MRWNRVERKVKWSRPARRERRERVEEECYRIKWLYAHKHDFELATLFDARISLSRAIPEISFRDWKHQLMKRESHQEDFEKVSLNLLHNQGKNWNFYNGTIIRDNCDIKFFCVKL